MVILTCVCRPNKWRKKKDKLCKNCNCVITNSSALELVKHRFAFHSFSEQLFDLSILLNLTKTNFFHLQHRRILKQM